MTSASVFARDFASWRDAQKRSSCSGRAHTGASLSSSSVAGDSASHHSSVSCAPSPSASTASERARSRSSRTCAASMSRRGDMSMQHASPEPCKPCSTQTRGFARASARWRRVLRSGEPLRSRRWPDPLTTANPNLEARSYTSHSSELSRWGTPREPSPRFFEASPFASFSTSCRLGRKTFLTIAERKGERCGGARSRPTPARQSRARHAAWAMWTA